MSRTRRITALLAAAALTNLQPAAAQTPSRPMVTPQPRRCHRAALRDPDRPGPRARRTDPPRCATKVKYVFVIFNENHSFDNEFGTFPGANGLYSDGQAPRDAAHTPGFTQTYTDADGKRVTVQPFRIGPAQNATFVDTLDHSHTGLAKKARRAARRRRPWTASPPTNTTRYARRGGAANIAKGAQFARLVMSYIDCDTIPFFWQYASRFALFDNIFATEDTPSTPNAIAMIAGQSGETQWVKHGAGGRPSRTVNGTPGRPQGPPAGATTRSRSGARSSTPRRPTASQPAP